MVDGDNRDVLQGISDEQKAVAEAQPEPVTGAEPAAGEAKTPPKTAPPAKKETPPAKA